MRDVQASEAKAHLLKLLDAVERGETIRITRRGQPIARLVPEAERRRAEVRRALEEMEALRREIGGLSVDDILSLRDEGRRL